MNKLIYIIAFVLLISSSTCRQEKKAINTGQACMEAIIKMDDSLGTIRNHFSEKEPISHSIINYTKALDQLDFQGCPDNFSVAFNSHKNAWLDMIPVTDKYPDLRGELHDVFDQIEKSKDSAAFKKALKSIWDTWAPIETAMKAK